MCGGADCKAWHHTVDAAYIARGFSEAEAHERFVMTTWHTDEPLEEVVWFAVQNAEYDDIGFKHLLLLALSGDEAFLRRLLESVRQEGAKWHAG